MVPDSITEDVAWFRVDHESAVGAVRRATVRLGTRLGLPEGRAAEAGIAVTEVAANQVKHAGGGNVLLRARRTEEHGVVEFVAVDRGPGMADIADALVDGASTAGTLGIGLGAVPRMASSWDVFSAPGHGTVLVAAFGPQPGHDVLDLPAAATVAGLTRPMTGEEVCGDGYAVRADAEVVSVLLADGLGHGPLAATAAAAAVRAFHAAAPGGASALLAAVHEGLRGTRGAAAAVAQYAGDGEVRYAGIGNISASVVDARQRRGMISHPGIAGAHARVVRETSYALPPHAVVILHSDGVTDRMDLSGTPALLSRSPLVIAAAVLRDFGVRNDDASVVALIPGQRP